MAYSAGTGWFYQTDGAAANGGGFDGSLGTPQLSLTDLVAAKDSTTVTSAVGGFTVGMVGYTLVITSGANFEPGEYPIASYVNANTITVALAPAKAGAGSAGVGVVSQGKNYALQAGAQVTYTDLVIGAADNTTATSALNPFTALHVGNIVNVTGGTGFTVQRAQIVSLSGVIATFDKALGTVGSTGGAGKLGGGLNLPTTALLNLLVAGNRVWFKSGTYTLTANSLPTAAGTSALMIWLKGYLSTPGDDPTGTNRPTIAAAANYFAFGSAAYWGFAHFIHTTTNVYGLGLSTGAKVVNVKVVQSSTTANYPAFFPGTGGVYFFRCEAVSPYGYGIQADALTGTAFRCHIHDCSVGLRATTGAPRLYDCLMESCGTAIACTTGEIILRNCTIHNCTTAILPSGASVNAMLVNNIIAYCGTGANWSGGVNYGSNWLDYNDWYLNTLDVAYATKGIHDTAYDPAFVGEHAWSDLASVAASKVLTSVAGGFTGRFAAGDLVRITQGTNFTAGLYPVASVESDTSLTLVTDPTSGGNGSAGVARTCTDFRLGTASQCRGAGAGLALGVAAASTVEQGAWQAGADDLLPEMYTRVMLALPPVAHSAANGLPTVGAGTGQLNVSGGRTDANLLYIMGAALTGTAAWVAAAWSKFFNKETPTGTINSLPDVIAGAAGGVSIVGSAMTLTSGERTSVATAIGDLDLATYEALAATGTKLGNFLALLRAVTAGKFARSADDLTLTFKEADGTTSICTITLSSDRSERTAVSAP